jgi:hypothetical protein
LLGLGRELERDQSEPGNGRWITNAVSYLDRVLPKNGARRIARDRLWLVVRGANAAQEAEARRLAADQSPGALVVVRAHLDQSYEPRIISVKEP